jgi:hypothetical protein
VVVRRLRAKKGEKQPVFRRFSSGFNHFSCDVLQAKSLICLYLLAIKANEKGTHPPGGVWPYRGTCGGFRLDVVIVPDGLQFFGKTGIGALLIPTASFLLGLEDSTNAGA